MYGPGPGFVPPQHRPRSRTAVIVLRVVFAVVPLLSLGFLSWVAMLRLAIMRRRGLDWALFWAELAVVVGCLVTLEDHFADHWISDVGMATLLITAAGVTAYYLVADIRHHRPAAAGPPLGAPVGPYGAYAHPQPAPAPPSLHSAHGYGYPPVHPHPQAQPQPQPQSPSPLPPPQPPHPQPQATPQPQRISQVRAELDELSDFLRKEQGR